MSVHLHRCERSDGLVRALGEVLRDTPADPFAPDVVAVPTRGIERFLAQELSRVLGAQDGRGDGVCANVVFPSPAHLVQEVLSRAGPPVTAARVPGDHAHPARLSPEADPWRAERLVWPLLATIDANADESWAQPLLRHLTGPPGSGADRRFAVASRLAGLFTSYGTQRPELLAAWADGTDTDGGGGKLSEDLLWQPTLWRLVRQRIAVPSPAERLDVARRAVLSDPSCVDLPDRINLFGPSRLSADQLAVLAALAPSREIHLWLPDASPALWSRQPPPRGPAAGSPVSATRSRRRRDDDSAGSVTNPLLRSLGRDARELRLRLGAALPIATDEHVASGSTADTLLARLQRDLRDDRVADADPVGTPPIDPGDRSIQVHACHGPARQAEVLREVVLGLLQDDPTLQPRDILVMCPDLATMAPLISAAFADPRPQAPTAHLRLRIADRTPEQANEVLAALDALLTLAPGRFRLSDVLDLIARPPVRARFALDDEDVARIEELAMGAGIRWGLDTHTRGAFGLPGLVTGTWQWGLDRILLGAALSEDGLPLVHGVLPLDDVPSGDVALIGRLAEVVERIRAFRDGCVGRHPLTHWVDLLRTAVTGLFDARGTDQWQVPHALGAVVALEDAAGPHGAAVALDLADVCWMLAGILAGRPTRSNFGSGGLTVCGLAPMRSVPHRVVCLVGLDDGVFPRTTVADGDDVLARDPWLGERDPRSEDRQILLDAIMAAGDSLIVTFTGADDRTNEPRPPCVPLGELLDALATTARCADGRSARAHVLTTHPLQPFDPRNFLPGSLGGSAAFSHDREALIGARATLAARTPAEPILGADLPPVPVAQTSLDELVRFLRAPAAEHLRSRLGLSLGARAHVVDEAIPLELDGLSAWEVGERSIAALAAGEDPSRIVAAERGRGLVPPGALGAGSLAQVGHTAQAIAARLTAARVGEPTLVPIDLALPSGRRLTGGVPDIHQGTLVRGSYSKPGARAQIGVWPELLAVAVAEPGTRWNAMLVCRGADVRLTAPPVERAAAILDELLDVLAIGMVRPLPLPQASAMAYAESRMRRYRAAAAERAAQGAWLTTVFADTGERRSWGEATDPAAVLLFGPEAPLSALLAEPPEPAEQWATDERSRFGALAMRIWGPVLTAREVLT